MAEKRVESSSVCKHYALGKTCRMGSSCRFRHSQEVTADTSVEASISHINTNALVRAADNGVPPSGNQVLAAKLLSIIRPKPLLPIEELTSLPMPSGYTPLPPPPGLAPPPGLKPTSAAISLPPRTDHTVHPVPADFLLDLPTDLSIQELTIDNDGGRCPEPINQVQSIDGGASFAKKGENKPRDETERSLVTAVASSVHHHRTVQCVGQLVVASRDGRGGRDTVLAPNQALRPNARLSVHYSFGDVTGLAGDFMLGLLRLAAPSNRHAIVAKPLPASGRGSVFFFAPKAAGQFVFRIFRNGDLSSTLAFSSTFRVVLGEQELETHLQFLLDAFDKEPPSLSCQRALSQTTSTLRGVQLRQQVLSPLGQEMRMLNQLASRLLAAAQLACRLSEKSEEDDEEDCDGPKSGEGERGDEQDAEGAGDQVAEGPAGRRPRRLTRLHREAHEALLALATNSPLVLSLAVEQRAQLIGALGCFCSVLKRFFTDPEQMHAAHLSSLGFRPVSLEEGRRVPWAAVCALVEGPLTHAALRLLPPSYFAEIREKIRSELEAGLRMHMDLPTTGRLLLYGSSCNNFGSEEADLDMCLLVNEGSRGSAEMEARLIEQVSLSLEQLGMVEIQTRPSARIPIVLFRNPVLNVEGDISVYNPLALANTRLLRAYSEIDGRIRLLVYIVKQWAKARQMNSPSNGTLSSYGYILTVIYFLQRRPIPLLPSLQELAPNWAGPQTHVTHGSSGAREERAWGEIPPAHLPSVFENSAADNRTCNVYFLNASPQQQQLLQRLASRNRESLSELLLAYFQFFAWQFDFSQQVVQIRSPGSLMPKFEKCESCAWSVSDILSIEDPFETWYDVAHVVKPPQMDYMRKEFLRAYTLASHIGTMKTATDFMSELTTPCEPPAFRPPPSRTHSS